MPTRKHNPKDANVAHVAPRKETDHRLDNHDRVVADLRARLDAIEAIIPTLARRKAFIPK